MVRNRVGVLIAIVVAHFQDDDFRLACFLQNEPPSSMKGNGIEFASSRELLKPKASDASEVGETGGRVQL